MPIYEYQCVRCSEVSEVFLRSGEKGPGKCTTCGGRLKRIISPAGFQFKGTGWYVTDYARKGKKDPARTEAVAGKAESGDSGGSSGADKTADKPAVEKKSA